MPRVTDGQAVPALALPSAPSGPESASPDDFSLLHVAAVLARRLRLLILLPLVLAVGVLVSGLLGHRLYTSSATFTPQAGNASRSRVSGLAAQFGIGLGGADPSQSPDFYVDLLQSREILASAITSRYVATLAGRQTPVTLEQLFRIEDPSPIRRRDLTIDMLRHRVAASSRVKTGIVSLAVTTEDPSVARSLAARLLELVNAFNLEKRKSQAGAERRFIEGRMEEAQRGLRRAEEALRSFSERNRRIESPELTLEEDRLKRAVQMQQDVYTSLAQSYEQVRLDELRDLPVITVIDEPELPSRPDPRHLVTKIAFAGLLGLVLATVLALVLEYVRPTVRPEGDVPDGEGFSRITALARDELRRMFFLGRRPPVPTMRP